MSRTPSLCGSYLTDKRSLVAFTWSITTALTLVAFILALAMMVQVHTHYIRLERYYEQYYNNNYNNNYEDNDGDRDEGEKDREEENKEADRQIQEYLALASISSRSMTFVAVYTMSVAFGLISYGTLAIVGFTSLRGVYIAPCFSSERPSKLTLGMFGGAIIFFANLLLVCAVIFGEVRVEDWRDMRDRDGEQREEMEPYEVERIATVLAVTCMFLSALYAIFAVLLYLYLGSEADGSILDETTGSVANQPLASITNDPRRENFITMGDA